MALTQTTQETGSQISDATSTRAESRAEDDGARAAYVRDAATKHASKHARLIRSAKDGRALSAAMLPFFALRPPSGYGVITTTGRRTGKARRKCVRVIRRGSKAYIVQLRPPKLAAERPSATAAWVWNIRANPSVRLRIRGGTFAGVARELTEPAELEPAREALCETVNLFDYGECDLHLRGLPTRAKIKELHRYWFDTGIPLVVELGA
jgi:deazaflavin-dependent oxidoreductase (nitroreductase family)